MVPYFEIPPLELGGLTLHAFDLLVAWAVVFGFLMGERRAREVGLDPRMVFDAGISAVVVGFIVSHLYSLFFYFPDRIAEDPWVLLRFWGEMSSFGGFLGGALGAIGWLRYQRAPVWIYTDPMAFGFTFAWIFGRMGCTVAHDHPGLPTDFFLAVVYPATTDYPAGPRHDLGFYELLLTLLLCGIFWARRRRPTAAGWHVAIILMIYMPVRFVFDFLRTQDTLYFGLTAGQYAAAALFVIGFWVLRQRQRVGEILTADGRVHVYADGRPAVPHTPPAPRTEVPG